jgi:hypothetical protein
MFRAIILPRVDLSISGSGRSTLKRVVRYLADPKSLSKYLRRVAKKHSPCAVDFARINPVPILPKVTNIGLQIFVTCAFYIFVTFDQYA